MKAAIIEEYGSPAEILDVKEKEKPILGEKDALSVIIKVKAAALNPVDYKMAIGTFSDLMSVSFPKTLGFDVSGVIVEVGVDVKRFKVGDEVFGDIGGKIGTLSEFVKARENALHLKPKNVTFKEAAATPLVSLTSYQALTTHGNLQKGEKVLILGGTTSTGAFGVQIAKHLGASEVTVTASNVKLAKSLGADHVVNYKEHDFGEYLKDGEFDLVYDCVGGAEEWVRAQKVLKTSGRFISLVGDLGNNRLTKGKLVSLTAATIRRSFRYSIGWGPRHKTMLTKSDVGETDLHEIATLLESGVVKPLIDEISDKIDFTTDGVRRGFEHLMSHRAKGKIVITIEE